MSKAIEVAYEKSLNTTFNIIESPKNLRIEVMDASILWPDFSGRITQFHKVLGEKRSFNIVLNDEMLSVLRQLEERREIRFRIHEADMFSLQDLEIRGCEQIKVHYINVKVNMGSAYPPSITLFTELQDPKTGAFTRSRNTLEGDAVNNLDHIRLVTADCDLNIYQSNPESPYVSAYLRKMNAKQEVQLEFGGRWTGWEHVTDDDVPLSEDEDINSATGECESESSK